MREKSLSDSTMVILLLAEQIRKIQKRRTGREIAIGLLSPSSSAFLLLLLTLLVPFSFVLS
jgi:hypothetical protein